MLHSSNLSNKFWADAIVTATYVSNLSLTYVVYMKKPYEDWFGMKPSMLHLRLFGCVAFAHQSSQIVQKWDTRAMKGIFGRLLSRWYSLQNLGS